MSILSSLSAVLAAVMMLPAAAAASVRDETLTVLVETAADVSAADVLDGIPGASLLCEYSLVDGFAARVPQSSFSALLSADGVVGADLSASFAAPTAVGRSVSSLPAGAAEDDVYRARDGREGEGTLIAILDTGFFTEHPAFTMPASVSETKLNEENFSLRTKGTYAAEVLSQKNEVPAYGTDKVPFAFDYAGMDTNVHCLVTHGTHVAALAGGAGELYGAAPGAQLLLMKVFDDGGEECQEHSLLLALEDAVKMGADVINLSLGTIARTGDSYGMNMLANALIRAEKAGVLVVCAVGNDGHAGIGGAQGDLPLAANPDYGLAAEPAVVPQALAVGAASNSVIYADYLRVGDRQIRYSECSEASTGIAPAFADALAGERLTLAVIDGLGRPSDYAGADVKDKIVLVRRGEISFREKVRAAHAAGAAAIIVYDPAGEQDFIMQMEDTPEIPAISVTKADGEFLAGKDGTRVTVPLTTGVFEGEADTVASFSSRGPTSDLKLKPELIAAGAYVLSAAGTDGYDAMSGTSMAAPQYSGAAAALLARYSGMLAELPEEERAAALKAYLCSAATPLTEEDGQTPVSVREQGAGMLRRDWPDVMITTDDFGCALALGETETGELTLPVRIINLSRESRTLRLGIRMTTDDAFYDSTSDTYRITGTAREVPHTWEISGEVGAEAVGDGTVRLVLGGGESLSLTLRVQADAQFCMTNRAVFENGFYLEGYVTLLAADGSHAGSLPFLSFCGDWNDAPILDGGDWDGHDSYYGGQYLLRPVLGENDVAGESPAGVLSELFAFAPNGDGRADTVMYEIHPFRNAAACHIEVVDAAGKTVYENSEHHILKTSYTDGALTSVLLPLWDGSDGRNDHYAWPDGAYTLRLTFVSYTSAAQTVYVPVIVDTTAPVLRECEVEDGVVYVSAEDGHFIKELRVYTPASPDGDEAPGALNESVRPDYDGTTHTAAMTAEVPRDCTAEYVYVSAEDYAGNITVVRLYL